MTQRRWTLINEGEHDFAHLSYDGPPIKVGERVEVVPADDQHRIAQLAEWIERDRRESDKVLAYAQELRRLAGRED